MIVIGAYELAGDGSITSSMIFRYAVISKVFKYEIPKDIKIKELSKDAISIIRTGQHSEIVDRLLFLYGAGVITEEAIIQLLIGNQSDFYDDVISAENIVIENESKNKEDNLTYKMIEDILLCAATSKKYPEVQPISFAEARTLAGLPHIAIINGLVKIRDKEYYDFLVNLGEKFGTITDEDTVRIEESAENLIECEDVKNGELNSKYYPFVVNLKRLLRYSAVYNEVYGKDFILYAKENSISIDETYESKYEEYVHIFKMKFIIKSYNRKRFICGNKINWFDYAVSADGNISDSLNADYIKEINLDLPDHYSDAELTRKAIDKFRNIVTLEENSVIEVFHNKKKLLYVFRNSEFIEINNDKFHTLLFDFDKIWSVIQLCSRNRQIRVNNGKITIPDNFMSEIKPIEREYAERIIKDQYSRMKQQQINNKLIQSFSQIKSAAENERAKMNNEKAVKDQKQQNIADKKQKREASTEG